jgi:predicted nucleic acid-binding protein
MKIVLDTNVFISGIFFSGPPYRILEAWRDGGLQPVISQEIFDEYRNVADELIHAVSNNRHHTDIGFCYQKLKINHSTRFTGTGLHGPG